MIYEAAHWPNYKSEQKVVNPGQPQDFFDFVPLVAPDGGRVVVDKFLINVNGTITVGTALWDGRDVWRLMQFIQVEKRDGRLRWALTGYKSRMASIKFNGIEEHSEHANVAVGASQTINLRAMIPMMKRFCRRSRDYSLPADAFKKITITWATVAAAATGTSVLSAPALNAYITVEWHSENVVEMKVDDAVNSVDLNSNNQGRVSVAGVVHDLDIVKEDTTAGGAVISAITDARLEDLGTPLLTFGDLQDAYTRKRSIAPSGFGATPNNERFLDPVRGSQMLPVITAGTMTSPWDGKVVDSLKVDMTTGIAGGSMIVRAVLDKSQADYQATCARFGLGDKDWSMRTPEGRAPLVNFNQRQKLTGVWVAPLRKAA